jgi:hypothetical protein
MCLIASLCVSIGRRRGCLVQPDKLPRFEEALMKLVQANLGPRVQGKMEGQDWRHVTQLLFKAKRLFFSPEDLAGVGFDDVIQFDLSAGQCLFARGGACLWFINQAPHTISLTTHVFDEGWLQVRRSCVTPLVCMRVCVCLC